LRIETRAGEISKGITVKNPALIAAATQVVESLPGAIGESRLSRHEDIKQQHN
jgi:carbamoyl-phosphate synthase large subunit